MSPEDLANAEAEIDVWAPMGENPCLPQMYVRAEFVRTEIESLRKALTQAEHRASLANRDYVVMRRDRDEWRAKFYRLESRGAL